MLCFEKYLKVKKWHLGVFSIKIQGLGIESLNVNPEDSYIVATMRNQLEKKKRKKRSALFFQTQEK